MITNQYCKVLAQYNEWMNSRIYELCATLTDTERRRDQWAFFQSIHGTFDHILSVDEMFVSRFDSESSISPMTNDRPNTFADLRRRREATDRRILKWSQEVTLDWLESVSTFKHHGDGLARTVTQGFWVVHMFNHQTHHRGQATTLLTQLGYDVGSTDLHMSLSTGEP
ncbi:MAG: DinB family protein [Methylocella sp.]